MFYCMADIMTISLPTNHFLVRRSIFGANHHINRGLFAAMYIWIKDSSFRQPRSLPRLSHEISESRGNRSMLNIDILSSDEHL